MPWFSRPQSSRGPGRQSLALAFVVAGALLVACSSASPSEDSEQRRVATARQSQDPVALPDLVLVELQDGLGGYVGAADTYLSLGAPTNPFGTSSSLFAGVQVSSQSSALMRWNVTAIPPLSVVTSAELSVDVFQDIAPGAAIELYEVKRDWDEGSATWQEARSGIPWEVAGARGTTDRGADVLGALGPADAGTRSAAQFGDAGLALVQRWIDGPANNLGVVIQDFGGLDELGFRSREASVSTLRPVLRITVLASPGTINLSDGGQVTLLDAGTAGSPPASSSDAGVTGSELDGGGSAPGKDAPLADGVPTDGTGAPFRIAPVSLGCGSVPGAAVALLPLVAMWLAAVRRARGRSRSADRR